MVYKNIKKIYNNKIVLDIDKIEFFDGKIYGITGSNGSGKSTLCKIISKIEKPDNNIMYPNITVGYMPQVSFPFNMTVLKNMLYCNNDITLVEDILTKLDLYKYKDKNAKKLSTGEKQKLSFARLMINKYDMLIFDEPTSNVDKQYIDIMEKMIIEYNKKYHSTLLLISHSEEQLKKICDNVYFMDKGKIFIK